MMFPNLVRFLRTVTLLPVQPTSASRKIRAVAAPASTDAIPRTRFGDKHDKPKVVKRREPAMEGIPAGTLQRTPPAAASPGLPPVDPVIEVPLASRAVYAGPREKAVESTRPGIRSTPVTAPGSPGSGGPIQADVGTDMRQGVALTAKLNPSPVGLNPCADPSANDVSVVVQQGLEQGSPLRWSDGSGHSEEPLSPLMTEGYERSAFDVFKDWDADLAKRELRLNGSGNRSLPAAATSSNLVVDSRAGDRLPRASKPAVAASRVPPRVADRPRAEEWADDELLTLPEAAALFWPAGPITTNTLRTAERDGALTVTKLAGKFFTTPQAIRRMGAENSTGKNMEVPDEASAATLFQMKLAEARRLGGGRARTKRGAKKTVAPAVSGRPGQ